MHNVDVMTNSYKFVGGVKGVLTELVSTAQSLRDTAGLPSLTDAQVEKLVLLVITDYGRSIDYPSPIERALMRNSRAINRKVKHNTTQHNIKE